MKTSSRTQSVYTSLPQWAASVPGLPLTEVKLLRLVRVASLGITAITEPILRPHGLTESSYHALVTIAASGSAGLAPGLLSELIGQTRSNMTRIVRLLSSKKLIRSLPDPHDARSRVLMISEAGLHLVNTQGRELGRLVAMAESTLTSREKSTLESLLRKMLASMDRTEEEALRTAASNRAHRPVQVNGVDLADRKARQKSPQRRQRA